MTSRMPRDVSQGYIRQPRTQLDQPKSYPSFKERLETMAEERNWRPPVYHSVKTVIPKGHARPQLFNAKVSVFGHSIPSHGDFRTSEEAEEDAAKRAFYELKDKKFVPAIDLNDSDVISQVIDNVILIVSEAPQQQYWSHGIEDEYFNRFKCHLPVNWIDVIKKDGRLNIEENNFSNVTRNLISLPINKRNYKVDAEKASNYSQNLKQPAEIPSLKKQPNQMTFASENVPGKRVDVTSTKIEEVGGGDCLKVDAKEIPRQQLPAINPNPKKDEDYFDVFVTVAVNPFEFYIRKGDCYSQNKFAKFEKEMFDFYESEENRIPELAASLLEEGLYVACKFQDKWHRALIMKVEQDHVYCKLVDVGSIHYLDLKDIQPLYNTFRSLPTQASRARLFGVKPKGNFWDTLGVIEFQNLVSNMSFVSIVNNVIMPNEVSKKEEPTLELTLIDTSTNDDIYVHKVLVEKEIANLT